MTIERPIDGLRRTAAEQDDMGWFVDITMVANVSHEAPETLSWRWSSSAQAGTLLNEDRGSTRLYTKTCETTEHVITATATDRAERRGRDQVTVWIQGPC